MFKRAERKKAKLRLALCGPSGSGKTYSALKIAMGIGGRIALIDSENGSGELYAHLCEYDVCPIGPPFTPSKYVDAIHEAERLGYDIIIIDSLTHAWAGSGGILEEVDNRKAMSNNPNGFSAWRTVTPMHNQFVDAMLQSPTHVIATMRSKTAYEMQKDPRTGKLKPVKIGLQPVQREGLDFEFTVVLDISQEKHVASASKDRTSLFDGSPFIPNEDTGKTLISWLEDGIDPDEAMVKEASDLISACTTVTGLRGVWQCEGKRWQSRPTAFAQISKLVAAKDAELKAQDQGQDNGVPDMPTEYDQQPGQPRDEFEPGAGGMGDPMPSEERGQGQSQPAEAEPLSDAQRKAIMAYFSKCGMAYTSHKEDVLNNLANFFQLDQPFTSIKDLTKDMASQFIDTINQEAA